MTSTNSISHAKFRIIWKHQNPEVQIEVANNIGVPKYEPETKLGGNTLPLLLPWQRLPQRNASQKMNLFPAFSSKNSKSKNVMVEPHVSLQAQPACSNPTRSLNCPIKYIQSNMKKNLLYNLTIRKFHTTSNG